VWITNSSMLKSRSRPGRRTRAGRGTWRCSRCAASHPPALTTTLAASEQTRNAWYRRSSRQHGIAGMPAGRWLAGTNSHGGCLIHRTNLVITTDDAMARNVREYQSTRDHQRINAQSTSPTWGRVAVYPSSSSNLRAVLLMACGWLSGSHV
jgi:hypothetical protein